MSRPRDIIIWGGTPFFGPSSSISRSMANALSDVGCRVLYLEMRPSPAEPAFTRPMSRPLRDTPPGPPPGFISVYTFRRIARLPITVPSILDVNVARNRPRLREAIRRLEFRNPLMIHYGWYSAGAAGRIGQGLDIADCDDAHEEIPRVRRTPGMRGYVIQRERRLLSRVQGLVVTSPVLLEGRLHRVPRTRVLFNGVDTEGFSQRGPEPPHLIPVGRPRAVLAGNLTTKLDLVLLDHVLDADPALQIVLVGPLQPGLVPPRSPRIHVLGPMPYSDLAQALQHCDVGLIPLVDTEYARALCPLKAFEYPAAGLPVVSSPNPVVESLNRAHPGMYRIARRPEDWMPAVRESLLAVASPGFRESSRQAMAQHTWKARAEALLNFAEELESVSPISS